MESLEQMTAMIGTTGREDGLYLLYNNIFSACEMEDFLAYQTPRQQKIILKNRRGIFSTWTWKKQSSTSTAYGWTLVRDNVQYFDAKTGQKID